MPTCIGQHYITASKQSSQNMISDYLLVRMTHEMDQTNQNIASDCFFCIVSYQINTFFLPVPENVVAFN